MDLLPSLMLRERTGEMDKESKQEKEKDRKESKGDKGMVELSENI